MSTMAWSKLPEGIFLTVHNEHAPGDLEWADYLRFAASELAELRVKGKPQRVLVFSAGGGPSQDQRLAMAKHLPDEQGHPVALLSDSVFARTIGRAIGLFNRQLRTFSTAQLTAALAFVGVAESRDAEVLDEFNRLAGLLGLAPPFSSKAVRF